MALVIETGEVVPGADSFATAAELVTYATNFGKAVPADEVLQARSGRSMIAISGQKQSTLRMIPFRTLSPGCRYSNTTPLMRLRRLAVLTGKNMPAGSTRSKPDFLPNISEREKACQP